jgi:hypothetical protein
VAVFHADGAFAAHGMGFRGGLVGSYAAGPRL